MALDVTREVAELNEEMVFDRRDLHQHPEIAFEEVRTAEKVARRLTSLGYKVRTGVGRTGVIGVLDSGRPGPTVMVRADIDALPVQEVSGRAHGSLVPGRMHACGHDAHTAIALGVASLLARAKGELHGKVKMVFQPAEEIISGAKEMVADGAMEDPHVDRVIGLHTWSPMEVGWVGVRPGPMWAAVDQLRLIVKGAGGHGGLPHLSVDPVATAAQIVTALQNLVAREVSPLRAAVVGWGSIHGGSQFNIIPDTVELRGNVRALSNEDRAYLLRRVEEVAGRVAAGLRAECTVEHVSGAPVVDNDPEVAEVVRQAAVESVGESRVIYPLEQAMAGDDVSEFMQKAPGCYFLVGCANPQRGIGAPHHSAEFDVDERALEIGAAILGRAALHYLKRG